MKKCEFCAEDIKEEATKCKHCGSNLSKEEIKKKDKKDRPPIQTIGMIILAILALYFFYISIPAVLIWYLWAKTKLSKKAKILITAIPSGLFLLGVIITMTISANTPPPTLTIFEPQDGLSVMSKTVIIKGKIEPKASQIKISDKDIVRPDNNGNFSYNYDRLDFGKNNITIEYWNIKETKKLNLSITRNPTPEEQAEMDKQKAEAEAKKKADEEQAKKTQEEYQAKKQAEENAYYATPAGQICKSHPEWSKLDCEKLASGTHRYWIGMTYDMLVYSYGSKPNSANPSNYGGDTHWQYCWYDFTPSCFYDENDDKIIDSYN